jgi:hypothetical protein
MASLICLYLGFAVAFHMLAEPSVIMGMTMLFIGFLSGVLGIFAFAKQLWTTLRLLVAVQELWIAVTPNGIVEYRGSKVGIGFACAFADVISVERINKLPIQAARFDPFNQGNALTFWRRDPANPKRCLARAWFVAPWYSHPDQLAQTIILAQRAYRSRRVASTSWGDFSSAEPIDPRKRQVANPTGWSWSLAVLGWFFAFMVFVVIGFLALLKINFPKRAIDIPLIPLGIAGAFLICALASWLLAWRINDWKKELK